MIGIGPVRRQSLISLGSNLAITAIGYIATVYIAHTAGAGPLGAFYLFLAYYSIANLFADGGISGAATQRISEGSEEDQFFSAHIAVKIVLLPLVLTAILLLEPFMIDFTSGGLFVWLLLAVVVGSAAGIVSCGVYGSGKVGVLQIAELAGTLVRTIVQVIAVFLGFLAAGLAGGFIAGVITGLIINLRFLEKKPVIFGWRHVTSMIPYASFVLLTGGLAVIVGYADTILVGYFMNSEDVGFYRTSFQLTTLALLGATALSTTLFPRISRWRKEGDFESIRAVISRSYTYSLILAIPVCIGGILLSDLLLYYLYGSPFAVAAPALNVLFIVQLVTIFQAIDSAALSAFKRPGMVFYANLAAAVAVVLLDILLIPMLGIMGAACALLVSMGIKSALAHAYLCNSVDIFPEWGSVLKIVIASAVMGLAVLLTRTLIPVSHFAILAGIVILGTILYMVVLVRIDRDIREELKGLSTNLGISWPGWL
jgi:O-antigen/teichoic acid export membrane protein